MHSPRRQHDSQYLGYCEVFLCRLPHSLEVWEMHETRYQELLQVCHQPSHHSYVIATMTPHDRASAPCVAISSSQHLLCPSVPPQSCLEMPPAVKMPGPCHLPPAGTRVSVSSCQLDSWMMDKVESFHPSYTRSLLQHGV